LAYSTLSGSESTIGLKTVALLNGVCMLLNNKQLLEKKIIDNVGPTSLRAASYDVRVGKVLAKPTKKEKTSVVLEDEYEIPPQGMVEVVSMERLTMPINVLGHATVKTRLSDECVLALGIGLIDPEYDSYLSSTLVNFGTQPFRLKKGDIFLRLTFHEFKRTEEDKSQIVKKDYEAYEEEKRRKVLNRFSETFLNLANTVDQAFSVVSGRLWLKVVEISALAALVVAVTTAAATVGISVLGSRLISAPDTEVQELRSNYSQLQKQFETTNKELQELRDSEAKAVQELRDREAALENRAVSNQPRKSKP
jgi:deoxycytidine triphosphate deaminase